MADNKINIDEMQEITVYSLGKSYDGLMPEGKVHIKPMTTKEEMILASGSNDMTKTINSIIKRCLVLPDGLSYDKLLLIDRFCILLNIRAITYGKDYTLRYNCPHCGKLSDLSIDLLNIDSTFADDNWKHIFECKLPRSGKVLKLKMRTVEDEESINNIKKSKGKTLTNTGLGDQTRLYSIAHHIVAIDGDESFSILDKIKFVESLPAMDTNEIDNALLSNELGANDIIFTCSECSYESEVGFPISPEFFRPRKRTSRNP